MYIIVGKIRGVGNSRTVTNLDKNKINNKNKKGK